MLLEEDFGMDKKRRITKIIMAFMGVFTGAGFASGQEIVQYFTSFGYWGIAGAILATILFAFVGMILVQFGSYYQATSHKDVFSSFTNKILYRIIDVIIVITLFVIGVVMLAGAGSNLNQQFNLPVWLGSAIVGLLIIGIGMLGTSNVISTISSITPFLIVFVLLISATTLLSTDFSFQELDPVARNLNSILPHWALSAVNYAAFNITFGASMAFVIGGEEKNQKVATYGGLLGGIGVGLLILLNHLSLFASVEQVGQSSLPMLALAENLHPIAGFLMAVVLFTLIWSTGMSLFYSFTSRFSDPGTKKFNIIMSIAVLVAFGLSSFGFTDLISNFYPLVGFAGFFIIAILIYGWVKVRKTNK